MSRPTPNKEATISTRTVASSPLSGARGTDGRVEKRELARLEETRDELRAQDHEDTDHRGEDERCRRVELERPQSGEAEHLPMGGVGGLAGVGRCSGVRSTIVSGLGGLRTTRSREHVRAPHTIPTVTIGTAVPAVTAVTDSAVTLP